LAGIRLVARQVLYLVVRQRDGARLRNSSQGTEQRD